tara:strand:+ start:3648 stop:3776 length:129 start_codon:yes stop_codon:yes gene_type:complete
MPFKSEKQKKYLYANKPSVAKKFQKDSKSKKGAKMNTGYKYK